MKQLTISYLKDLNKRLIPCLLASTLVGCANLSLASGPPATSTPTTSTGISTGVQTQLDEATTINLNSAQNSLTQARIAYGNIAGRVNNMASIDNEAFLSVPDKLLTPLVLTANSLSAMPNLNQDQVQTLVADFKQIYFDSLEQMQQGINGNLRTYQNNLESPQSLFANNPDAATIGFNDDALISLAELFQAMEITEQFVTQLNQFNVLLANAEYPTILATLQQQQVTVINGVINFSRQGTSANGVLQAYATISKSLTSPNLLSQFQQIAIRALGADRVAFKQSEVTPLQPNPNQIELVIQEAPTIYRKMTVVNGVMTNQIINDNRGLSAADLLNATTAIRVVGQVQTTPVSGTSGQAGTSSSTTTTTTGQTQPTTGNTSGQSSAGTNTSSSTSTSTQTGTGTQSSTPTTETTQPTPTGETVL